MLDLTYLYMIALNERRHNHQVTFGWQPVSGKAGIVRYRGLRYLFCKCTARNAKLGVLFTLALWEREG